MMKKKRASGVVHNEVPSVGVTTHSLQLWVNFPRDKKMTMPRYQNLKSEEMPVRREDGAVIRVFSGSSMDVVSTPENHVPVTMVEILVEAGKTVTKDQFLSRRKRDIRSKQCKGFKGSSDVARSGKQRGIK